MENILKRRRIQIKKSDDENYQFFIKNTYSLQNLIAKFSILSYLENIIFLHKIIY